MRVPIISATSSITAKKIKMPSRMYSTPWAMSPSDANKWLYKTDGRVRTLTSAPVSLSPVAQSTTERGVPNVISRSVIPAGAASEPTVYAGWK